MGIYLDYNATTPLDPRVLEVMLPYLQTIHGNASSVHHFGRRVRTAIDHAREQVANLVNAHPSNIIFTSSGTEANNLALKGTACHAEVGRLMISRIEHASLYTPALSLERQGWIVDYLPVDNTGRVKQDYLTIPPDTRLVSVMTANNETGVIQPIADIAEYCRTHNIVFHTDASQAIGKIPVDFTATGANLMTLSGHKFYAPLGSGALITDKTTLLEPLLHGGGQEKGLRGGTENVAAIVGLGKAAELATDELEKRQRHTRQLRDTLETLLHTLSSVNIFAESVERLPNTLMISVAGFTGETILMGLDRLGFAVSSGSACHSEKTEPSHVLMAMGIDATTAKSAIRISLGNQNTPEDIQQFYQALKQQIEQTQLLMALG
ncbi:cysteine desulfurase family protein [Beggiatoa leptomitoformis]|uniref:Aminotransferase class V-fold PLP-dependent enzyme n=1 Tax=Beggiatoa leptomitoformis TaxID=288004 RepID=A0A2N9YIJ5_9GAMM|nr:cysteine desulfurase family protein [Beggiatoa leptomitoformis]ALG67582.1 aminotransferase class V-fold PLP-dependent enzyme [Beggiatoa leptomitoformis]AUI70185.1 aminotransferase class V-fold PLP-dependent enzyme [Beggiatoa leptomitoformis]